MPGGHHEFPRPRVAALRLTDDEHSAIRPLIGELRPAPDGFTYARRWNESETDLVIVRNGHEHQLEGGHDGIPVLAIGDQHRGGPWKSGTGHFRWQSFPNTSRVLHANDDPLYEVFSDAMHQLIDAYDQSTAAPAVKLENRRASVPLVCTGDGHLVAGLIAGGIFAEGSRPNEFVLVVPEGADLRLWVRAYVTYLHGTLPEGFPHAPPRTADPARWRVPEESAVYEEIARVDDRRTALEQERADLLRSLDTLVPAADEGPRRLLWNDGGPLAGQTSATFEALGFTVDDRDAKVAPGEPKAEDYRISDPDDTDWEALVEVKGYEKGARTNDLQTIRKHRDKYIAEERQEPSATLWVVNSHRRLDPDDRPPLDINVDAQCKLVGVTAIPTTDLFMLWSDVAHGRVEVEIAREHVRRAEPGVWRYRSESD